MSLDVDDAPLAPVVRVEIAVRVVRDGGDDRTFTETAALALLGTDARAARLQRLADVVGRYLKTLRDEA